MYITLLILLFLRRSESKLHISSPPMGWSTWYAYGGQINENIIKRTALILREEGFLERGYEYINIDDAWSAPMRDPYTNRFD
jgi:alpha-galactosidase